MKKTLLALSIAILFNPIVAIAEDTTDDVNNKSIEHMQILSHGDKLRTESGSATLLTELELEKHEYDDIHRILASVPGVNIREEDGFGLRPNIGFRGVTPERSKKITILEDGVLIGPAPYSAPAAYYFPVTTRMTAVEVFKGPSAIKHGPQTVAGTLNLVTRSIPTHNEGGLDLSLGTEGYAKAHAYFGETHDNIGTLFEAVHIEADGFKDLDGGGNTGFEKNDFLAKVNYLIDGKKYDQIIELKLSYADEVSNETYLGLTEDDFNTNPYRRYAATQPAKMDTKHTQIMFTHNLNSDNLNVTTRLYRNDYERAWRKLNGLTNTTASLSEILENPKNENNIAQYQVISGQIDSNRGIGETNLNLIMGTNDRSYVSQGIQVNADFTVKLFDLQHDISVGVRLHEDEIDRSHFEEIYEMKDGSALKTIQPAYDATQNIESTKALSIYLEDSITIDNLTVSAGLRSEYMDMHYNDKVKTDDWQDKTTSILLPGLSGFYKLSENSGLLAGVYQGFSPSSPKQGPEVEVEKSINYEFGGRYNKDNTKLELVSFFNDYDNLKASCSQSTGCNDDQEYDGGRATVYGLEAQLQQSYSINSHIDVPLSLVYTYTQSEFKEEFVSEYEPWGHVLPGYEIPDLAEHQTTLNIGLDANNWQFNLSVRYVGEMLSSAGERDDINVLRTDESAIFDISASYELGDYGRIYGKVDNLTDEATIVSHKPYGVRPGKPRLMSIGYKYQF
ncbi:TonB-dependent receptor [Pseudoalteromonas sp. NBT06-2]|uniref:TonB-dependent receptor family protein n=1 Tax=Pseudoalteromonas sp. NBT06-2 TaxID=2025950 RepID=UPI000BA66833|nr:TonB-dependent receptor [Pseudoalteromonas sp. NBT06-2]PAJ76153.1 TonB-dependent receptor [Pseudoalteromonas sp. NBT06-2]